MATLFVPLAQAHIFTKKYIDRQDYAQVNQEDLTFCEYPALHCPFIFDNGHETVQGYYRKDDTHVSVKKYKKPLTHGNLVTFFKEQQEWYLLNKMSAYL